LSELAAFAIVFVAAFTQGAIGFGFGLVAMAVLPLVVGELVAIPLVAVASLVVSTLIAWRERRHLAWRRLGPPLVGVLAGVPLGLFFLAAVDPRYIRLALGLFLVLYSLYALFLALRLRPRLIADRPWGGVAGLASGVLGGAFNTGGPPLVVYATLKGWGKDEATSTLQVLFTLTSVIAIGGHLASGRLHAEVLPSILATLPVVAAGVWLGGRVYDRIDQATFRKALLALLLVAGVVFVQKSLVVG